jgi:hypothetical protein
MSEMRKYIFEVFVTCYGLMAGYSGFVLPT